MRRDCATLARTMRDGPRDPVKWIRVGTLVLFSLALFSLACDDDRRTADSPRPGVDAGRALDAALPRDADPPVLDVSTPGTVPQVLNGGFERTGLTAECHSNLSNAEATAALDDIVVFGELDEIDVYGAECYGSTSPEGTFRVGIGARDEATDALSLALSEPIRAGRSYLLRLSAEQGDVGAGGARSTVLEIGLSNSPTEFGELLGDTGTLPDESTEFEIIVTPSANGSFLTMRNQVDGDLGWAMVDDVRLAVP